MTIANAVVAFLSKAIEVILLQGTSYVIWERTTLREVSVKTTRYQI